MRMEIEHAFGYEKELKCGLTSAKKTGNVMSIVHYGNMGNAEKSINENLKILGLPTIKKMKENFFVMNEDGVPDYMYEIIFRI